MMKSASFAAFLIASNLFGIPEAWACRVPPRPDALRRVEADAIILAQITWVEAAEGRWSAAARFRGNLMGSVPQREFSFTNRPDGFISSCEQMGAPRPGSHWVLYLRNSEDGFSVHRGFPFWWARASGDSRLSRLNRLMPLGAARPPTRDEVRLLEMVEPRVQIPAGEADLSRYTRVYARASATIVTGRLLRSRTPQRLMVDSSEELPTEESCGCDLVDVTVQLDDLWAAGQLPPFEP